MSEKPFHILLVDDDPDDIKLAKIQLSKINMELEVNSVSSREAFQDYLNREPLPDLVICDYQLPEYNGEKALEYVRDLHIYLPFILVTGYLGEDEALELMRNGASDIITKQKLERLGPAVQRELTHFYERKEAQQKLEVAQNRFQSLVEQGGDVVVVFDEERIPDYISPSIETVFGYPVEEAMSINLDEVTHPDDFNKVNEALKRAMKSPGENISVPPVRMKHKDGTWRWCKTSLTDLRHQPSVSGIVDNIRDIHEQVLNARNNQLMLNNTEDSFIYINRDLIIQNFNDLFARNYKDIFGRDVHKGDSILDYAEPERREIVKEIYGRVFEGETVENELPLDTKGGRKRYFHIKYKPARDEHGEIIGSFISLIEITEEKKAKRELEKNEARFRALVEKGSDVLFILNPEGETKYISPSIKNVLGYTAEEAMQINMMDNAHPDDTEMIITEIKKCLDQPGIPLKVPPARLKDKDGNWHWFEGTITNMLHDPVIGGIVDNFHEITERIEAEQKIAEAKDQYQSLVQTINGVFWEAEPNTFQVTYMSPQSLKMFGYDPDEWIETKGFWIDRVHPEEQESILNKYKSMTQGGENHELEYRFKKSNGDYIWIRDIISVISAKGEPEVVRGLMTDITQEKELELKLDQAFDMAKIGSWELDLVNERLFWSQYIKEIHEVDKDYEPDLETALNFYKEGWSRDRISEAVKNSIENGDSFDLELPIITQKENEKWIRAVGKPEFFDGKCVRIFGSTQDITDRKKAQLERQKAEEKYRNVVEHSTNMFYQHDTDGVLTYVSPQSEEFLGYPPEEAMRKWTDFITDHPINKRGEKFTHLALKTGEIQEPYELQLQTGDGRIIWVEVNEAPLKKNGKVVGIVGSLSNITDRKKFEERLKESLERYDYASKATRDAIYDWDIINDHHHWGDGFEILFGHDKDLNKFTIDDWLAHVHPSDLEKMQTDLECSLKDESFNQWQFEYRLKKADGEYAYILDNGYIIRNEDGKAIRMIGAVRDISEEKLKEIQSQLQQNLSGLFTSETYLKPAIQKVLQHLVKQKNLALAELWLTSYNKKKINRFSTYSNNQYGESFKLNSEDINQFNIGEGLPGTVLKNNEIEVWDHIYSTSSDFIRHKSAKEADLKSAFGIPLKYGKSVIGVILLASEESAEKVKKKLDVYSGLPDFLGAEIKRKQQEEEMQLLFDDAPDILAIVAPDNHFIKVNPAFSEIIGYSEDEITGQNFENFVHPDDLKDTRNEYKETVSGQRRANNYVNRWRTKSGEYRWISWNSSDVFGEDGFVFSYGRDVTEQKMAENEIRETNKKLNTAQNIAKLGYWQYNIKSDDLFWSDEVYRIWGIQSDIEVDLDYFLKTIHPDDVDSFNEHREKALSGEIEHNIEHRIVCDDGSVKWVHEKGELIKDENGNSVKFEGTVQDISERKELEELLRLTNQLAKVGSWELEIRENGDDSMYWSDTTKEILEVDDEYNPTLTGGFEFYEPRSKKIIQAVVHKAITEGTSFDEQLRITTAKGKKKWIRSIGDAEIVDGVCTRIYGSFQDITDRVEAERERVRILESIGDAFFAVDKSWTVTYWNNVAVEVLNRQRNEIVGKNLWDVYEDATELEFYHQYHKAVNEGVIVNFEEYYPTLEKWFDVSAYPSENGLSVFFRDISDRKRNEEKIRNINERFEKVTEATNDAIWDFDVAENNLIWGKGFETLFGYDLEEIKPTLEFLMKLIHPDDRNRVAENIQSYMKPGGQTDWFEEYRFQRADGSYAYVMDRAVFIRDKNEEVNRVVGAMTDLSRQKEYEESLEELNKELEERADELAETNAELEQFAYVASHDLQEPLRMVTSFLSQLEKKYSDQLDEKAEKYIYYAVDGAQRMRQIILDLLNYSRLNRDQLEKEKIDLNEVIEEVLTLTRSRIEEKNAIINVDDLPVINANPGAVKQVFQNLLSNALKYHELDSVPEISINVEEGKQSWKFSITDNGIGIEPEFQETIFQIFQRLHTRDKYSGTGIGLAIAKKIIDRHGGEIWVDSKEGEGSTFYFTISKE